MIEETRATDARLGLPLSVADDAGFAAAKAHKCRRIAVQLAAYG